MEELRETKYALGSMIYKRDKPGLFAFA